ncbi:unnamed protein product [Protopolystoma xenopodis]|uniref:Uncharacterized protein n=1 Tax=Protopolystoma xenopodis TaxID=117903 RepID=A0A448WJW7_9PLAT|nr:unnamed protein product [Protopolystoma xenopodis]
MRVTSTATNDLLQPSEHWLRRFAEVGLHDLDLSRCRHLTAEALLAGLHLWLTEHRLACISDRLAAFQLLAYPVSWLIVRRLEGIRQHLHATTEAPMSSMLPRPDRSDSLFDLSTGRQLWECLAIVRNYFDSSSIRIRHIIDVDGQQMKMAIDDIDNLLGSFQSPGLYVLPSLEEITYRKFASAWTELHKLAMDK